MARRARPTLQDSRSSDSAKRKATVAPSACSPIATAPSTATVISTFMSRESERKERRAFGITSQPPVTIAARKAASGCQPSLNPNHCSSRPSPVAMPEVATRIVSAEGRLPRCFPSWTVTPLLLMAWAITERESFPSWKTVTFEATISACTPSTPGNGFNARSMAATSSEQSIPATGKTSFASALENGLVKAYLLLGGEEP